MKLFKQILVLPIACIGGFLLIMWFIFNSLSELSDSLVLYTEGIIKKILGEDYE